MRVIYGGAVFVVAHRTPRTAAECAALAAAGVSFFELDVQVQHGRLVVSHFLPVLGTRGLVENDNWRFRLRSLADPAVDEVLPLIPASCRVLLDPKETRARRRAELVDLVLARPDRDRFAVSTTSEEDLGRLRSEGVQTWRTVKNVFGLGEILKAGRAGRKLDHAALSVRHTMLTPTRVEQLREVVPTIVAWTVNDVQRARSLVEWGVEGITTDKAAAITQI